MAWNTRHTLAAGAPNLRKASQQVHQMYGTS